MKKTNTRPSKCAFEGCDNPPENISGKPRKFCPEHSHIRRLSPNMRKTLKLLKDAKDSGFPFIYLPNLHCNTRASLLEHYWAFESLGDDGVRWKITSLGEKALAAHLKRQSRQDGICPVCEVRPRHVTESGRKLAYCTECARTYEKTRERPTKCLKPRKCSICNRPARRYATGSYSTYCLNCERTQRKKLVLARVSRIRSGKEPVPMCGRCKEKPCRISDQVIRAYCPDCQSVVSKNHRITKARARLKIGKTHAR